MNKTLKELFIESYLEAMPEEIEKILKEKVHEICLEIIEDEANGVEWRRLKDDKPNNEK